jgi:hypothetical protein
VPPGHAQEPPAPEQTLPPEQLLGLSQQVPGAMQEVPQTLPPVGFGCEQTPLEHASVVHGLPSLPQAVPSARLPVTAHSPGSHEKGA